jgi:hypothetical protein
MSGYCTRADVTALLPSGGLPNPARVATGNATADTLESEGHGLALDAEVSFRAEGDDGALPAPLVEGTTYYAIPVSSAHFQVSATQGGSAIPLTTDGVDFVFMADLPFDAWIEAAARDCDSFLPTHVTPVVAPYPAILVTANAELAGVRGLMATAGASISYGERLDAIRVRLTQWAKTIPLRGAAQSVTSPVNLAITSTAGAADPRGWATCGNDRIP